MCLLIFVERKQKQYPFWWCPSLFHSWKKKKKTYHNHSFKNDQFSKRRRRHETARVAILNHKRVTNLPSVYASRSDEKLHSFRFLSKIEKYNPYNQCPHTHTIYPPASALLEAELEVGVWKREAQSWRLEKKENEYPSNRNGGARASEH